MVDAAAEQRPSNLVTEAELDGEPASIHFPVAAYEREGQGWRACSPMVGTYTPASVAGASMPSLTTPGLSSADVTPLVGHASHGRYSSAARDAEFGAQLARASRDGTLADGWRARPQGGSPVWHSTAQDGQLPH